VITIHALGVVLTIVVGFVFDAEAAVYVAIAWFGGIWGTLGLIAGDFFD
jgi:hypothetical protein